MDMVYIKSVKIKKDLTRVEVRTSKDKLIGTLKLSKSYIITVPYLIKSRGKKHREYQLLLDKAHSEHSEY